MNAIRYFTYGGPDVLRLERVDVPTPADDQVRVKVHAASVNPLDWHFMRGTPYALRLQAGLRAPRDARLGVDVAGVVDAVGPNATQLHVGDEAFGTARGSFAEYACGPERSLTRKPGAVPFDQAAAAGVAAITALQAVRDTGRTRAGDRVLVNGASGGVGTFAVQIARSFGAHVTAVCGPRNLDLMRSLDCDQVIDYTTHDFTSDGQRYDVIVDNVGGQSLRACRRALTSQGRYVLIGGPAGRWIAPFDRVIGAALLSRFVSQSMEFLLARVNGDDFACLSGLLADGTVRSVLDREYPLADVPRAMAYLEAGHARGKVVIRVA